MVQTCEILTTTSNTGIGGNGRTLERIGIFVETGSPYIGTATNISFWLHRENWIGPDTGTVSVTHYDSDGTTVLSTSNTMAITDISLIVLTKYTFTISLNISSGDYIVLSASDFPLTNPSEVTMMGEQYDPQEFTGNTFVKYNSDTSAWTLLTGSVQTCMEVTSTPVASSPKLPPPPITVRF